MSTDFPVPQSYTDTLFAAANCLNRIAVIGKDRNWTWADIHTAALELTERIPDGHLVCNLCHSNLAFFITWIATLRRRLPIVLPPSRGVADLELVISTARSPVVVITDQATHPELNATFLKYLPNTKAKTLPAQALRWQADLRQAKVTLYSSGSTGKPEAKSRSLTQLYAGALQLGTRLGLTEDSGPIPLQNEVNHIVSCVPPQHMFGIETVVMISFAFAKTVLNQRPLLPSDIQDAIVSCKSKVMWVATPIHLRAISRTSTELHSCSLTITSTMPLSRELACATETLTQSPIIEIYGSTETGALATRRTSKDPDWRPLDDVKVTFGPSIVEVSGPHFDSPQPIADALEPLCSNRFSLTGRNTDLIKIGGRRTSLAALNGVLLSINQIDDGVFIAPNQDSLGRLALIYANKNEVPIQVLWSALRKRIDPVFLPRIMIRVDKLPRNERGKVNRTELMTLYTQHLQAKKK